MHTKWRPVGGGGGHPGLALVAHWPTWLKMKKASLCVNLWSAFVVHMWKVVTLYMTDKEKSSWENQTSVILYSAQLIQEAVCNEVVGVDVDALIDSVS